MSDHFKTIYATRAALYDRMVEHEDYEGNILKALDAIRPMYELDVVEMGAGTGRLTRLLAPLVKSIYAFDISGHMLARAAQRLKRSGASNWSLAVGDNRALPIRDSIASVAIEGWSFAHVMGWYPDTWHEEASKALAEMKRVLRPGGTAIMLETMGTGNEIPAPPAEELATFYKWLEEEQGFSTQSIRTDYKFTSVEEADELTRFFFGDELADRVAHEKLHIVPECTGIWWRTMG